MKIISKPMPFKVTCQYCNSVIKIKAADWIYIRDFDPNYSCIDCPICKHYIKFERNKINENSKDE